MKLQLFHKSVQEKVHEKVKKNIEKLHHTLPNWERYLLMCCVPLYFMLISLTQQAPGEVLKGVENIIREPDILISDYFVVGGVGAAFFNAGCLAIISLGILCFTKSDFDGSCIVAACLMFGFSLFGKNLLNIWSILMGYVLYAKVHQVPIKKYLYIGFYGTTLSPIITQIMLTKTLPFHWQLLLAVSVGLIIGYVLVPISLHTKHAHMGYSLYNVGFSCGIIATIVTSLMKSFGAKIESRLLWDTGHRLFGFHSLLALFLTLILLSLVIGRGETLSSYFEHIRNILPVLIGVIIASYLKIWDLNDPSSTLTLILSTTLAPITGEFGILWGMVAGFLHSSVALNVGAVYNGTNLYNNGFAGGIVAIFLVPIIQSVRSRMKPSALYKKEGGTGTNESK